MRILSTASSLMLLTALVSGQSAPGQQPVNPAGAAALEFHKAIEAYVAIHNAAEGKVPALGNTTDPAKISERETALGKAIQALRPTAKPGDVFVPAMQPYLTKIVREDFAKRSPAARKAIVQELPKNMKVAVNMVYPTTLPLETFPGKLLRLLPDLPPELEYRIVGRHLLLRDVKANLIVDVIRGIVPTIPS